LSGDAVRALLDGTTGGGSTKLLFDFAA